MAKKLLLLCHGDIDENYHNRYIGSEDISMSDVGHQQVKALNLWILKRGIDSCYCSPMKRCMESAKIVLEQIGMGCKIEPELRDMDFGRWEGLPFDEVKRNFHDDVSKWNEFDKDFTFPEGERIGDFINRIVSIADCLEADSADTILVCTHRMVIQLLICYFLGLDPWQHILFQVKPASVTTIELFDGVGILSGMHQEEQEI